VFEELGRAGVIEPFLPAVLGGGLIARLGQGAQSELIESIMAGSHIAALAHSEPGARFDLTHVETAAIVDGSNGILLNGTKTHVGYGAVAQSLVVSAREFGDVQDQTGLSLFLVPEETQGLRIEGHANIDGTAGATVHLDNVRLTDSDRLGSAGAAFDAIEASVAFGITALCAEALGAMETSMRLTTEYLKDRRQFGVPLGTFQALQHRIADLMTHLQQVRSAVINIAGHLDQPRALRERHVSAAKNLVGRIGAQVAEESVQMHGGIGMTEEYALAHFARRLTMIDHLYGDVDYHLARFIALKAA